LSGAGAVVADRLPINLGASHAARTAVGVALPGAVIALLWLLGGCFAFFGYVFALLLASFGLGALLVKVLKLGDPAPAPASAAPVAPAPEPAAGGAEPSAAAEAPADSVAAASAASAADEQPSAAPSEPAPSA